jgi:hypothetical protein
MDAPYAAIDVHCLHNFTCSATFLLAAVEQAVSQMAKSDYVSKFDYGEVRSGAHCRPPTRPIDIIK